MNSCGWQHNKDNDCADEVLHEVACTYNATFAACESAANGSVLQLTLALYYVGLDFNCIAQDSQTKLELVAVILRTVEMIGIEVNLLADLTSVSGPRAAGFQGSHLLRRT